MLNEMARKTMKYIVNSKCRLALFMLTLTAVLLTVVGCGGTPGETSTERCVRYETIVRTDMETIKSDIDAVLLMDKRSKLSDMPIRDY